jgi:hypothetical protein
VLGKDSVEALVYVRRSPRTKEDIILSLIVAPVLSSLLSSQNRPMGNFTNLYPEFSPM